MPGAFPWIHSRSSQLSQVQGWRVGKKPQADVEPRGLQKPNACPLKRTCLRQRENPPGQMDGQSMAGIHSRSQRQQECVSRDAVSSLGPWSRTREGHGAPCAFPIPHHSSASGSHPGHPWQVSHSEGDIPLPPLTCPQLSRVPGKTCDAKRPTTEMAQHRGCHQHRTRGLHARGAAGGIAEQRGGGWEGLTADETGPLPTCPSTRHAGPHVPSAL